MKRKQPSQPQAEVPRAATRQNKSSARPALLIAAVILIAGGALWWLAQRNTPSATMSSANPAGTKFALENEATAYAQYGGSASCRDCHAKEFAAWSASNHGLAERALNPALDQAAFDPPREIVHGTQKSQARKNGEHSEILTLGLNGQTETYRAERVIGHDPLRQFLVAAPGGRLQTLELSWDPKKTEWFNVYGNEDRKPGEWGHWTGRGMTWNTMCAACHNTRVRKNYDPVKDEFHTTMAERTVSCESCHGPMKAHNAWQHENRGAKNDPTIKKLTRDQTLDTCASCHARRAELTGDFKPGDSFFDHYALSITDESDLFYPDGQVRDEDYEFTSFLSSKMHAAGVRCLDCHDPHSAKTIATGDALCMRCHATPTPQFPKAPVIVPVAHTFHKPESAGSQCINCHMPQTTYMQRHPRHDHGFTIPDPLLTKEAGIPNACNRCHTDKDADWSLGFVTQWYGDKMKRPTRQRALMVASARRGEIVSRDALIAWLKGDDTPSWKASSALLLGQWAQEPAVTEALQEQLRHESPMVRSAAVHALGSIANGGNNPARDALRPLLKDPSRNVRLAAAWALRDDVNPDSPAGIELQHMLALSADQPSGRMQLGQYEYSRGHPDAAIAQLRKAIEWDPNSPPFHHDLAIMLSASGHLQEAIASLETAIKLDPRQALYHYELGLAWSEAGDIDQTIKALEQTVILDPAMSRAWYNLGLARNAKGNASGAIEALTRGEMANPRDAALPYARATILLKLGNKEEALAAAQAALRVQPDMMQARQLIQMLTGRSGTP
ncbi:MAG: tetratricopeptide repeat protein [Verrucomicrobia bacterium]|nr:tetratricopeptide repeat protein [Verrucomicrobiota bacterium]